jgi:hypothetical protein
MLDRELVFAQHADVVVTLQDGRQLDGWMVRFEHGFECERTRFAGWEIDEVFPQPT